MADNPARWADLKAMGFETPVQLSKGRHPSLPYPLMAEFTADLRARDAIAARALEFLILTNERTDAVLKVTWDQLDLNEAVWTVPLVNLKDRKHRTEGFRVPLVERAVEIVQQMRRGQVSGYVFPGQAHGKPLSNMALLTLLKRMNAGEKKWLDPATRRPITVHGFRATFRTWAEEVATFPHAVIEQAMGHQVGTQVERAYRRTDVLDILARAILLFTAGDNSQRIIRKRSLQFESLGRVGYSHKSTSAGVVKMTGIALGWIGATIAFASVVRKPNKSCVPSTGALFGPLTPRQGVHRPANANKGRSSLSANHFGVLRGLVSAYSQKEVAGTMQRFCLPSQPRQCGLPTLRMLVIGAPPN
jgi:hypothetical protein